MNNKDGFAGMQSRLCAIRIKLTVFALSGQKESIISRMFNNFPKEQGFFSRFFVSLRG